MIFEIFYDLSLFISVKPFLPSVRVLKTNQESEEIKNTVRVIREIKVVSIFLVNLLKIDLSLLFKNQKNFKY